jgi:hypothetical protein
MTRSRPACDGHLVRSVLPVDDHVIAGYGDHRDSLLGEVTAECGQPRSDVLDVGAVIADEGDNEPSAGEVVEADRRAGRGSGSEKCGAGVPNASMVDPIGMSARATFVSSDPVAVGLVNNT